MLIDVYYDRKTVLKAMPNVCEVFGSTYELIKGMQRQTTNYLLFLKIVQECASIISKTSRFLSSYLAEGDNGDGSIYFDSCCSIGRVSLMCIECCLI